MPTSAPFDMWEAATLLTETPLRQRPGLTGRKARRRERARHAASIGVAGFALLSGATALAAISVAPVFVQPMLILGGVGLLLLAVSRFVRWVSVGTFRRVSRAQVSSLQVLWWVATLMGFAILALTLIWAAIALVSLSSEDLTGQGYWKAAWIAVASTVVAVVLAICSSSAAQPLVSTSPPRLWQQLWAQGLWTAALCTAVVTGCALALPLTPHAVAWAGPFDAAGLIITAGLALVTGIIAWHVRTRERLAGTRRELLTLLDEAARACRLGPSAGDAPVTRLLEAVSLDPLRSQSPAAMPTAAGSEITTVTTALRSACRGLPLGDAWVQRAGLPSPEGDVFAAAITLFSRRPDAFLRAGADFIDRCHDELLVGRRRPPRSNDEVATAPSFPAVFRPER